MDWQFGTGNDSNDIIVIVRTSYRGAVSSSGPYLFAPYPQSFWVFSAHLHHAKLDPYVPMPITSTYMLQQRANASWFLLCYTEQLACKSCHRLGITTYRAMMLLVNVCRWTLATPIGSPSCVCQPGASWFPRQLQAPSVPQVFISKAGRPAMFLCCMVLCCVNHM